MKTRSAATNQGTHPNGAVKNATGKGEAVKHRRVRDQITEAIRRGEFAVGSRLPAERELAARFGVSYMTARRAVTEMVEVDLLERRAREGTYVRGHSRRRVSSPTVNLICSDSESSGFKAFLRLSAREAEARGWRAHVLRLQQDHDRAAVRALENGEMALVLAEGPELGGPLGEAMQKAGGRAVLIGNRLDSVGVPSVLADDTQAIRLAVARLKSAGHRRIALLSDHPDHAIDRVQIAAWRSCFAGEASQNELDARLIIVNTPRFESSAEHAYQAVKAFLQSQGDLVTAMVSLHDELGMAALAACRDSNRAVPERMSLVNSGDSPIMAFAHPPVTCIDVNLERHIESAMEMLQAASQGALAPLGLLRLVEPHLIERQSVAAPASI